MKRIGPQTLEGLFLLGFLHPRLMSSQRRREPQDVDDEQCTPCKWACTGTCISCSNTLLKQWLGYRKFNLGAFGATTYVKISLLASFRLRHLKCFKLNTVVLLFRTSSSRSLQQWPGSEICITNKVCGHADVATLLKLYRPKQNLSKIAWKEFSPIQYITCERTLEFLIVNQLYGWQLCRVGIVDTCFPPSIMCP